MSTEGRRIANTIPARTSITYGRFADVTRNSISVGISIVKTHDIHYYITPLRNRHLAFFLRGLASTRLVPARVNSRAPRAPRTSRSRESRLGSRSRNGSVDFASARIPLVALADILAAAGLHRGGANRIACVKGKCMRAYARSCSRARAYRSHSGIVSMPDVDCDTKVCAKTIALRFRNFNDPPSLRLYSDPYASLHETRYVEITRTLLNCMRFYQQNPIKLYLHVVSYWEPVRTMSI